MIYYIRKETITINSFNDTTYLDYIKEYGYCNDIDEEDVDLHIKNPYQYRCRSWYSRYSDEVDRMTEYYERLNAENAKTNTITRKATLEEIKMYEEQINKTDCHRLVLSKK